MRFNNISTAIFPMQDREMRIVVNDGVLIALNGISSTPIIDKSSGIR